jgi:hypothetical protein
MMLHASADYLWHHHVGAKLDALFAITASLRPAFWLEMAMKPVGPCWDRPPDRHVHWTSRADWYVHGDELRVED